MKLLKRIAAAALAAVTVMICGCTNTGDAVYTYNGKNIGEYMYSYWLSTYKANIIYSYNDLKDTSEFWESEIEDGVSVESYFTGIIDTQMKKYAIALSLFDEYKLKLDDETIEAIDSDIEEKISSYGSRAAFNSELAELGINIDILREIYLCEAKYDAVYEYLFGTSGIYAPGDEEIEDYYNRKYNRIKYIVLYTTKIVYDDDGSYKYDDDGNIMTEDMTSEELAAVYKKRDEILARVDSGESYEDLISEYTEYDISESYPNGLFVSENEIGTYGADFTHAAIDMEQGEVRSIEQSTCIYVLKKYSLTALEDLESEDTKQLSYLIEYASKELYDKHLEGMFDKVRVDEDVLKRYDLSECNANINSSL